MQIFTGAWLHISQRYNYQRKKKIYAVIFKASWDIGTNVRMPLSYKINILIFIILFLMYKICHHWQQCQHHEYLLITLQGVVQSGLEVTPDCVEICKLYSKWHLYGWQGEFLWTSKCPSTINVLVDYACVDTSSLNKCFASLSSCCYWAIRAIPCIRAIVHWGK